MWAVGLPQQSAKSERVWIWQLDYYSSQLKARECGCGQLDYYSSQLKARECGLRQLHYSCQQKEQNVSLDSKSSGKRSQGMIAVNVLYTTPAAKSRLSASGDIIISVQDSKAAVHCCKLFQQSVRCLTVFRNLSAKIIRCFVSECILSFSHTHTHTHKKESLREL